MLESMSSSVSCWELDRNRKINQSLRRNRNGSKRFRRRKLLADISAKLSPVTRPNYSFHSFPRGIYRGGSHLSMASSSGPHRRTATHAGGCLDNEHITSFSIRFLHQLRHFITGSEATVYSPVAPSYFFLYRPGLIDYCLTAAVEVAIFNPMTPCPWAAAVCLSRIPPHRPGWPQDSKGVF